MKKQSLTSKLGLGLLAMFFTTFSATAAENDVDLIVLDSVVVTASGYEQNIAEAPASITVINREQIEKSTVNKSKNQPQQTLSIS